ncbi:MAG: hypothetical protein ACXV5J_09685 [Candidatus Angelobacter sp.]
MGRSGPANYVLAFGSFHYQPKKGETAVTISPQEAAQPIVRRQAAFSGHHRPGVANLM